MLEFLLYAGVRYTERDLRRWTVLLAVEGGSLRLDASAERERRAVVVQRLLEGGAGKGNITNKY